MHKKSAIIIIIIFLGVIVMGALLITRQIRVQSPVVFLDEPQQIVGDNTTTTTLSRDGESLTTIDEPANGNSISREEAAALYGNSKITLDLLCQATPQTISTKTQTIVMIENQSQKEREISISSRTYIIGGEDYVLAAFNKTGEFKILCDKEIVSGTLSVTR